MKPLLPRLSFTIFTLFFLIAPESRAERQRLGDLPEKTPEKRGKNPKDKDLSLENKQRMMSEVVETFYKKGKRAMAEGRLEQAEAFFDRVLILQPNHTGARKNLQRILQIIDEQNPIKKEKDQKVSALGGLEKELKQHVSKENWDKAGRVARKILTIDPKNALAKQTLDKINQTMFTKALERAKQKEKAEEWEAAIEAYQMALGYKMEPAIRTKIQSLLEKVRQKNEAASDVLYLKALSASQEGNISGALDYCKKALQLNPKNIEAQRMLERLKSKVRS